MAPDAAGARATQYVTATGSPRLVPIAMMRANTQSKAKTPRS